MNGARFNRKKVIVLMRAVVAVAVVLTLGLYACSERIVPPAVPPNPAVKPAPRPVQPPPVVQTPPPLATGADWRDWPVTPGNWVYRPSSTRSQAVFGADPAAPKFAVTCDKSAGQVMLSHAGAFPPGETGRMTIRTTSGQNTLTVANGGGTPAMVAATLPPRDPQLDSMAYSRGRFVVSIKGSPDLVVPSWSEFARVLEDCRG
jgi:hypothetical protein